MLRLLLLLLLMVPRAAMAQDATTQTGPVLCSDGVTMGYASGEVLAADVQITGGARDFALCPQTTLSLTTAPLSIAHSVILRCGNEGVSADNCVLEGGAQQVIITGDIAFIEFHGITFTQSTTESVQITAEDSTVTFIDCIWRQHSGLRVIMMGTVLPEIVIPDDSGADNTTTITTNTNNDTLFNNETVMSTYVPVYYNETDPMTGYYNGTPPLVGNSTPVADPLLPLNDTTIPAGNEPNGTSTGLTPPPMDLMPLDNNTNDSFLTPDTNYYPPVDLGNDTMFGDPMLPVDEMPVDPLPVTNVDAGNNTYLNPMDQVDVPTVDTTTTPNLPDIPGLDTGFFGRKRFHNQARREQSSLTVEMEKCQFSDNTVTQAIMVNNGGTLTVKGTTLSFNNVPAAEIVNLQGTLNMDNVTFLDTQGTAFAQVFVSSLSGLYSQNSCGNMPLICRGTYYQSYVTTGYCPFHFPSCVGECIPFQDDYCWNDANQTDTNVTNPSSPPGEGPQAQECPTNSSMVGYTNFTDIETDLYQGVTEFPLCPGSVIGGSFVLAVSDTVLVFNCLDQSCVWIANGSHLRLQGENFGVRISGITFRGATDESVVLEYQNGSEANYLFDECVWEGNTGTGVFVQITYSADIPSRRRLDRNSFSEDADGISIFHDDEDSRFLQDGTHHLMRCTFQNNTVGDVVYVEKSAIRLNDCDFQNNAAGGSTITVVNTSIALSSVSFEGNSFQAEQGMVYLSGQDSLLEDSTTCASSNIAGAGGDTSCGGILEESTAVCTELPLCQDSEDGQDGDNGEADGGTGGPCVDGLSNLTAQVDAFSETLILCPNTTIDLADSPLVLTTPNMTLQCGEQGVSVDGCVIRGGTDQIVVAAPGIFITGMTFVESTRSSISVGGDGSSGAPSVIIQGCEFSGHMGLAVILNDMLGDDVGSDATLSSLDPSQSPAMAIEIEDCFFADNDVTLAPVMNGKGTLLMDRVIFESNTGEVGAVASLFGGEISVQNSCFLGNSGNSTSSSIASTIHVDATSSLQLNDENFGFGNDVASGDCAEGISVENYGCSPFSARLCNASLFSSNFEFTDFSSCVNDTTLLTDIMSGDQNEVVLCPFSKFDLGTGEGGPLSIQRSNLKILCGDDGSRLNSCEIAGGQTQIEISGSVTDVVFQGLTFVGSSASSVEVLASAPFNVKFLDCVWMESQGDDVIMLSSIDPPLNASAQGEDIFPGDGILSGRYLAESGISVALTHCSFDSNSVPGSLIRNAGVALNVSSCTFSENSVGQSIVSVESGSLALESTCFRSNDVTSAEGLISSSDNASLVSTSNFVDGGGGVGFNATFCEAPLIADCFSDWNSLSESVSFASTLGESSVFTLCPYSVIEVDPGRSIDLDVSDTVIQCGPDGVATDSCILSGGSIQFRTFTGVEFRGITMQNTAIAAIHAAGEQQADSLLRIHDCIFSDNQGLASVIAYKGDIRRRSTTGQSSLLTQTEPVQSLQVQDSIFASNNVEFAPLSVFGGTLTLDSSAFSENVGLSSGVGIWYGSSLLLSINCFNSSSVLPSILIDAGSVFDGIGNPDSSSPDACVGALVDGECREILSQNCTTESSTPPPNGCYSNWSDLRMAVMSSSTQTRDSVSIIICEEAVLYIGQDDISPIVVSGNDVTIQCGDQGSQTGGCVISGGRSHFMTHGSGKTTFVGITFEGASFASILATADSSSTATFTGCTWRDNQSEAVVVVSQESQEILNVEHVADLLSSPGPAMEVNMDQCTYESNNVAFAVIANIGGHVTLLETVMSGNHDSRFGVLAAFAGAEVGISYSCFFDNSASDRGIIFIDKDSTRDFKGNSFGASNTVENDACLSIFQETENSCVEDVMSCQGDCLEFDRLSCPVTDVTVNGTLGNETSVTFAPSFTPDTLFPTAAPVAPESGGGGGGGGATAGAIVAVLVVAVIVGYIWYRRRKKRKTKVAGAQPQGDEDGKLFPTAVGDGSHSRSKTEGMEDDGYDYEDEPLNQSGTYDYDYADEAVDHHDRLDPLAMPASQNDLEQGEDDDYEAGMANHDHAEQDDHDDEDHDNHDIVESDDEGHGDAGHEDHDNYDLAEEHNEEDQGFDAEVSSPHYEVQEDGDVEAFADENDPGDAPQAEVGVRKSGPMGMLRGLSGRGSKASTMSSLTEGDRGPINSSPPPVNQPKEFVRIPRARSKSKGMDILGMGEAPTTF